MIFSWICADLYSTRGVESDIHIYDLVLIVILVEEWRRQVSTLYSVQLLPKMRLAVDFGLVLLHGPDLNCGLVISSMVLPSRWLCASTYSIVLN